MNKKVFPIVRNSISDLLTIIIVSFFLFACSDGDKTIYPSIPKQPETLPELLSQYNQNIAAYQALMNQSAPIIDYTDNGQGGYNLQLSNGIIANAQAQTADEQEIPLLGINDEGYWFYQLNGKELPLNVSQGGAQAPALEKTRKGILTPQLAIGEDGYWQVSYNGMQWARLSHIPAASLAGKTATDFSLFSSVSFDEEAETLTLKPRVGNGTLVTETRTSGTAKAWKKFLLNSDDNVLLDYSYAGYDHGESAPKDGFAWGYKVYNVKEYMIQNGFEKPLDAFIDILDKNNLIRKTNNKAANPNAQIVIYFPEGEYIMHNGESGTEYSSKKVFPYDIIGGNFIIKGDGPDKTRLVMKGSNGGKSLTGEEKYDVAPLLTIKNYGGINNPVKVMADAKRGSKSIIVGDAGNFKANDWVALRLCSNDPELVAKELGPITAGNGWAITKRPDAGGTYDGVRVIEYHQVKSVNGNKVTFYEPMMHDIEIKYDDFEDGWKLYKYSCYEHVGIEDLTFEGQSVTPYYHHGDGVPADEVWKHDSEYKMVLMMKVVNSWVRNVNFISSSDPLQFSEAANCSAYNISIGGNRGHGAVRAAGSTRIFMGAVRDVSRDGTPRPNGAVGEGQWHGCGVAKPSIGTVVWRSNWGINACFESHASQPRATLFDNCFGGLLYYHEGGADTEAPNHLGDLTLWNLNVTGTVDENGKNYSTDFKWHTDKWWQIYPPIVVRTHGSPVTFSNEEGQLTYEESTGVKVAPESLYEAQLEKRLGVLPVWLQTLKK